MRAYFFVNSALSGIQKGLQAAHCAVEMANKANPVSDDGKIDVYPDITLNDGFHLWARDHKTIIVLEGGFHQDLKDLCEFFGARHTRSLSGYTWASFTEDEETMNGMVTCVGIIIPEKIYETARIVRSGPSYFDFDMPEGYDATKFANGTWVDDFTEWEVAFIKMLNSCRMAR